MLIGVDASRATSAQRTGTEVYSLHLIRRLAEVGTAHRFRLYLNTPPAPGLLPSMAHCEQRVMPFPRLWTHLRLSAEMSIHPPDVLFVPSHVLPLIHARRSVVTVHDLGHRYHPNAHTARQRWYLEWSTRYHTRTAAHMLADSRATQDDLVRLYGVDRAQITVVHLGVDPAFEPVHDPEAIARVRHRYGIQGPYLLYLGTLQPRKNLVRLIEAFAEMGKWANSQHAIRNTQYAIHNTRGRTLSVHATLQLVLAGKKGWLYEDMMARVRALGLEGQVVFPGYVDDADLPALYSGASLFVMPSLYEGFCLPVLEAMACGTPVVCSNVSSIPEVVGEAALLFDPQDVGGLATAMARTMGDKGLRATLIARGRERAQRFTWERCARQVLDVLERIADR